MGVSLVLLGTIVAIALIFDWVNGFHDAANSVATVVSTRVLPPYMAVLWAAFFNFVAILVFAPRVADTISKIVRVTPHDIAYVYVILTALIAAIAWGIITWRLGLPTSSSHALIGGLAGAGVMYGGWGVLHWEKFFEIMAFIVLSPLLGFCLGLLLMWGLYWGFRNWQPTKIQGFFRRGQLVSAAFYSIGHGANDAQKTMGIILALLIASGHVAADTEISLENPETVWIILSCQAAMAFGTALGGWRIVKTMGMKIVKLKPIGGFSAETAAASSLFLATYFGIPVSTTHTITGAIIGVGTVSSKLSRIKWGVAGQVVWAWLLTIPFSGLLAAGLFWGLRLIVL